MFSFLSFLPLNFSSSSLHSKTWWLKTTALVEHLHLLSVRISWTVLILWARLSGLQLDLAVVSDVSWQVGRGLAGLGWPWLGWMGWLGSFSVVSHPPLGSPCLVHTEIVEVQKREQESTGPSEAQVQKWHILSSPAFYWAKKLQSQPGVRGFVNTPYFFIGKIILQWAQIQGE